MKSFLLCLSLLVAGCAPSTLLIPDGNGFVELTQTNHIWQSNVISVGHCTNPEFSKCPKGTYKQLYVMTGPGPGMAGAGIQAAGTLGGAAILGDGIKKSKSSVSNSNTTHEQISTKNVGK